MNRNNIKWKKCLGMRKDEARAMAGHYVGFQFLTRQYSQEII